MPRTKIGLGLAGVLTLGLLAPAVATGEQPQRQPVRNVQQIIDHGRLASRMCEYARDKGATDCRVTSVLKSWDGRSEVVGDPFLTEDGYSVLAARRCTASHPCRVHARLARRYVWTLCYGYHNGCRDKDYNAVVWWKVRQKGEFWRARTCEYSLRIPAPHNCASWANWTFDNNWHRIGFRTGGRSGWHVCQRVSSSGFAIEIDRCWVSDHRDPADVRTRYNRDRWLADRGWVGMRWTRSYWPGQHRTRLDWIKLGTGGRLRRGTN